MQRRRRARQRRQLPSVSAAARAAAAVTAALFVNAPTAADGLVTPPLKALSKQWMRSSRPGGNSSNSICCIKRAGSGGPATIRRDTGRNRGVFVERRSSLVPGSHRPYEGGRSRLKSSSAMTMCGWDSRRGVLDAGSRFNARTSTNTPLYAMPPNQGTDMDTSGGGNSGGGGTRKHQVESNGTWRRIGDVPSLVVGVGFLLARHRRELRASNERRHAESNRAAEEAAAVARAAAAGAAASEVGSVRKRHRGARSARDRRRRDDLFADRNGGVGDDREGIDREATEEVEEVGMDQEEWREMQEVTEERQRQNGRNVKVTGSRRSAPEEALPSRTSSLDVSLDRCVLPKPVGPFALWGTGVSASLLAVAVVARIPRLVGTIGNAVTQTVEPAYQKSELPAVVEGLRYSCRLWAGSFRSWASQRAEAWERAFGPEEETLPAEDWSVCTLLERNLEGNNVVRYRFDLQDSPNAVLPLELGQEMTLCGLDAANHVVHGSYVPLTPRKQRGYFDIAVRRESEEMGDGLGSTRSDREFSRFLDSLPLGDEIAVKPGREGLVYNGPYSPVTDLVLIATGLGVVPMIQMVNELLPYRDSSVSSAAVVWLNEKADDFALYSHLEEAFFRNHRKLDVSCIVERDLFGHQLESNANLREAAPDFKIGTLAAVAGPDFFVRKVAEYLVGRGYPEEVIIKL